MKSTFVSLALMAAVVAAKGGNGKGNGNGKANKGRPDTRENDGNDRQFVNFQSKFNKHYKSEGELEKRRGRYKKNEIAIEAQNLKSERSGKKDGLRLKMNFLGDMEPEEIKAHMMGVAPDIENRAVSLPRGKGRHLEARATAVDHAADGWMGPVKQQG